MKVYTSKFKKSKQYSFSTIKLWQQTNSIMNSFGYINQSWWFEPPMFFVYELSQLFEIYTWFSLTAAMSYRSLFNHYLICPKTTLLYLISDLNEYNELFGKQIDKSKLFSMETDLLLLKPPITYLEPKLLVDQDFTTLHDEKIEQQRVQDEKEMEELKEFWKKKSWSKKLPPRKPRLLLDIQESYIELFPFDKECNSWFYIDFSKNISFKWWIALADYVIWDILDRFLEWMNLIHVVWSYIHRWVWDEVKYLLFRHTFYYFPIQSHFPDFLKFKILRNYIFTWNALYAPTALDDRFVWFWLPGADELEKELPNSFLEPTFLDLKLPWINFSFVFIYFAKPIFFKWPMFQLFINFSYLNFYLLEEHFKKVQVSFYYQRSPLYHSILNWLETFWYFILKIPIIVNSIENILVRFFTLKFTKIAKDLSYSKHLTTLTLLPFLNKTTLLIFLRKRNRLWPYYFTFSINCSRLTNDQLFFWPFFWEFDWSKSSFLPTKRKRGWPKKQKPFYFDSEKEYFESIFALRKKNLDSLKLFLEKYFPLCDEDLNFYIEIYLVARIFFYFLPAKIK